MTRKQLIFGLIILCAMIMSSATVLAKDNSIYFRSPVPSLSQDSNLANQYLQNNMTNDGSLPKQQLYQKILSIYLFLSF